MPPPPPPLLGGSRPPPLPRRPAPPKTGSPAADSGFDSLLQLVPLFEETKPFLRPVSTKDSSAPRLESEGLARQNGASARQQLM
eukprot:SAG31_NODE_7956_length_1554_cov_1.427885_1_plen_83_part_10